MPYVLISCTLQCHTGPTIVGDGRSDPALMESIGARLENPKGQKYSYWVVNDSPREVLDKFEEKGYRLITTTGVGQTIVWTLHLK